MDRVIFLVQLLLLGLILQRSHAVLITKQSDEIYDHFSELEEEIVSMETNIMRIRGLKQQYRQYYGECKGNLTEQNHTLQTTLWNLTESEAANSHLKTTIDDLTNTVISLNQTQQRLCEKQKQLQVIIDGKTETEEANNRTIQELLEKQKQMQANIDGQTKREEANNQTVQGLLEKQKQLKAIIDGQKKKEVANNRTVQELLEKQKQLQANIGDLTNTVDSLNQTLQLLCEQPEDACWHLLEAAKSGNANTAKLLVKCTSDSCIENKYHGDTPLAIAADNGHLEVVRVLLEGGANVNRTDASYRNALHRAAYFGHLDVCRLLLEWGAKVDSLDASKNTPLHEASKEGHLSVVKLLKEKGADVSVKNIFGRKASEEARIRKHNEVANWLDRLGQG